MIDSCIITVYKSLFNASSEYSYITYFILPEWCNRARKTNIDELWLNNTNDTFFQKEVSAQYKKIHNKYYRNNGMNKSGDYKRNYSIQGREVDSIVDGCVCEYIHVWTDVTGMTYFSQHWVCRKGVLETPYLMETLCFYNTRQPVMVRNQVLEIRGFNLAPSLYCSFSVVQI